MNKTFEFKVAGLDEDGKIIVLVKDDQYGDYTFALSFDEIENEQLKVDYDFASDVTIPLPRQQEVVQEVVQYIFETIKADMEENDE